MDIQHYYKLLFPNDTVKASKLTKRVHREKYKNCPIWPTDVFAFCGSIIEKTSLLQPEFLTSTQKSQLQPEKIHEISKAWQTGIFPPIEVVKSWEAIYQNRKTKILDIEKDIDIQFHLHFLLRCADSTSAGLGWRPSTRSFFNISAFLCLALATSPSPKIKKLQKMLSSILPNSNLPNSFCLMIPQDRVIVTPKSVTAQIGHTFRSLSHNLALIDAKPKLEFSWHYVQKENEDEHFHILLIPYPFKISAKAIRPVSPPTKYGENGQKYGYFTLHPDWLPSVDNSIDTKEISTKQAEKIFSELVLPLLKKSETHCDIDCILFPECSLTEAVADKLAELILTSEETKKIRLLITGALAIQKDEKSFNKAISYFIFSSEVIKHDHTKHHRWKLDVNQIKKYGFSSFPADHNTDWWEYINVSKRKLPFYAVSPHSSITVLVCEDLARNDPAMPTVRAIGPNLIIALLMDGPQITGRWPAKYAGVLSEDPGSSVLSVTSVAMVDRSNKLESAPKRSVALWQRPGGRTQSIDLPQDSYGLVLSLATTTVEQVTMSQVVDECNTRCYELMGVEPLKLEKSVDWL
ncbi:hypothetical protein [Chromobacterium amazonense]|uniref:CN hydrolase domain-containing protein n=1 Tax=Chromobacterium amazonense TaxID=1382803 RepID=A0ABU8V2Q5_9NEIS|nr:hypothetical protein [Chromobacterium amazonense]MDQ4539268.1 hypothetical protein [Chromobacterium amazonense]